jgi:hypothetical protein
LREGFGPAFVITAVPLDLAIKERSRKTRSVEMRE